MLSAGRFFVVSVCAVCLAKTDASEQDLHLILRLVDAVALYLNNKTDRPLVPILAPPAPQVKLYQRLLVLVRFEPRLFLSSSGPKHTSGRTGQSTRSNRAASSLKSLTTGRGRLLRLKQRQRRLPLACSKDGTTSSLTSRQFGHLL